MDGPGSACRASVAVSDNYAVLFDSHNHPLDFRREVSAVEYRHRLDILRKGPGRGIFRSVAQCFVGCIQPSVGFVCSASGVVTARRNLLSCIDATSCAVLSML
jgi:hypothetical protein